MKNKFKDKKIKYKNFEDIDKKELKHINGGQDKARFEKVWNSFLDLFK